MPEHQHARLRVGTESGWPWALLAGLVLGAIMVAVGEAFAHVMDCWQITLPASARMGISAIR